MSALMYRSIRGQVHAVGNLSYVIDHGELKQAQGKENKFFLSNEGTGVNPLVLLGSYKEILDYMDKNPDIKIVNQSNFDSRNIYVSVGVFRSGSARFESVSAQSIAINSIVGFATGSIMPGLMPVAGTGAHVTAGLAGTFSELYSSVTRTFSCQSANNSPQSEEVGQGQTFAVRFSHFESNSKFSFNAGDDAGVATMADMRIPVQITIQQVLGM
jgi:hypothetical protein